ncbi:MAG: beta-ketoacyl synthase N-terminal-like domain-containing protein, partial [Bacteroidota bacterium]
MNRIAIVDWHAVSALGTSREVVATAYQNAAHYLRYCSSCGDWVSRVPDAVEPLLEELRATNKHYQRLDRSVLLAIAATAPLKHKLGTRCGLNIGSSRGATELFERYHGQFQGAPFGKLTPVSSPNTTLGNLASNVANYLGLNGIALSHSITCSTALHSVLNGVAWLQSGLSDQFIVGGTEAPLTPFTVAQMKALHLYSREASAWPCRAMDLQKTANTMVLGEAAASFLLERDEEQEAVAFIEGIGYATETVRHGPAISDSAQCLQDSMRMALRGTDMTTVDAIVMHSPGTIKGDLSEYRAIEKVFGENIPWLTTNKWKIGHTLGASGALSLEMALIMLLWENYPAIPFYKQTQPDRPANKMLTAFPPKPTAFINIFLGG